MKIEKNVGASDECNETILYTLRGSTAVKRIEVTLTRSESPKIRVGADFRIEWLASKKGYRLDKLLAPFHENFILGQISTDLICLSSDDSPLDKISSFLHLIAKLEEVEKNHFQFILKDLENFLPKVAVSLPLPKATYDERHSLMVRISGDLALVYASQGRFKKAVEAYKNIIKIAIKEKNYISAATSLNNLGNVYVELGHFVIARKDYQTALRIYQIAKQEEAKGQTDFLLKLSHFREANQLFLKGKQEEATKSYRLSGFPTTSEMYTKLSDIFYKNNMLFAAIEQHEVHLRMQLAEDSTSLHHNLACLYHAKVKLIKDWDKEGAAEAIKKAQEHFEAALKNAHPDICPEYANFILQISLQALLTASEKLLTPANKEEEEAEALSGTLAESTIPRPMLHSLGSSATAVTALEPARPALPEEESKQKPEGSNPPSPRRV